MAKLHFTYDMQIDYSETISNCNFTIKCIPVNSLIQEIDNLKIGILPDTSYQWGNDGFNNSYIWGKCAEPHNKFIFTIEGDAKTGLSDHQQFQDTDNIFYYPHGLNVAGREIREFYDKNIKNIYTCTFDKVINITNLLHEKFIYQAGSTNVNTTAEEAFRQGCGVCQDYSHILISLLHLSGIAARYVTGFIIGEGESHAWVEFLVDNKWYGIDPTNNKQVNDDFIKISHGRDAKDCMINRGIIRGGGFHTQTINVNVQKV